MAKSLEEEIEESKLIEKDTPGDYSSPWDKIFK